MVVKMCGSVNDSGALHVLGTCHKVTFIVGGSGKTQL